MPRMFVSAASMIFQIIVIMLPGGGVAIAGYQIIRWWRNKHAPPKTETSKRPA